MKHAILIFLALVAASAAYAKSDAPRPFSVAVPVGPDPMMPLSFKFSAFPWECRVTAGGSGLCVHAGNRWRFALPTGGGEIEKLFFSASDVIVLAYEVTDQESGWAYVVGFHPKARHPQWRAHIRGLNLAIPILKDRSVLIAALTFVGSIDQGDGHFDWRHEFVYNGSGRTSTDMSVVDGTLVVKSLNVEHADDVLTACYSLATGVIVSCPAQD